MAGNGNQKGTLQTSPSPAPLAQGSTASTAAYDSPGGDMTVALSYPGSLMKLEILNAQSQVVATGQGPPPIVLRVPAAPAGQTWRIILFALALLIAAAMVLIPADRTARRRA